MKKIITICGSMKVRESMILNGKKLEERGVEVYLPSMDEGNEYENMSVEERSMRKNHLMVLHLEKIKKSDSILVVNETQKGIEHYIGANSFLEMGFAFSLGKTIYLLNDIPDQPNELEILGMLPKTLHGNLINLTM